jgi:hypothetical protein
MFARFGSLSLLFCIAASGCHDYAMLKKSFCDTATKTIVDANGHSTTSPVALCDGFEGTDINAGLWLRDDSTDGTVQIAHEDGTGHGLRANRGVGSLMADTMHGGHAYVVENQLTPTLTAAPPPSRGSDTYFAVRIFVTGSGSSPVGRVPVVSFEDATGRPQLQLQFIDGYIGVQDFRNGQDTVSRGQLGSSWFCAELRFGATLTVWNGDSEVPLFDVPGFSQQPLSTTRIGMARSATESYTGEEGVLIDDVIIDNQDIGCEK